MSDSEIDRNKAAFLELTVIVGGAMLLASAVLFMDEPPPSWNVDKNVTQPIEIIYLPIPEPSPLRPSYMIEWPLAERMIAIEPEAKPAPDTEDVKAKEEKDPEPKVEKAVERREYRRRWRHYRRWRRYR